MEYEHIPVLYREVLEGLAVREGGVYIDGTLGGGGHAKGICERLGERGILVGIDKDAEAIEAAGARLQGTACRKFLVQENYANVRAVLGALGLEQADGALLDLGVSSYQLDNPARGFSYMHDGPLDMRMDEKSPLTAETVVNEYSVGELERIIASYGEERWAGRIAQFIGNARKEKRITSTLQLVEIIKAAIPASARREGPHPAKRTFQALRIEVNDELGSLREALEAFATVLKSGGRLAVITFHSLEDRIVKEFFQRRLHPCTCPPDFPVCVCGRKPDVRKVTGKPITPGERDLAENPRARSAKLRIIEKI